MKEHKILFLALLVSFFSVDNLLARDWHTMKVPGAKCGDGSDYEIHFSKGNTNKLIVEFMGGGACWSAGSCYGPNLRAWIRQIPTFLATSVMASSDPKLSPFTEHNYIYFPYCTGDVHAGRHTAKYALGLKAHHQGFNNVVSGLNLVNNKNLVDFKGLNEVVLYGASAGAIASFIHSKTIEKMITPSTRKIIIADAPGLHFSNGFWKKFTKNLLNDFKFVFGRLGMTIDHNDGMLAPQLTKVCSTLSDWKIGILQGAQDIVMSAIFGEVSLKEHKNLVYSKNGVYQVTKASNNCSAWVPDTKMHTFLLIEKSSNMKANGFSALEFAWKTYRGNTDQNYK